MSAQNERTMPVVTARIVGANWVLDLPNGQYIARDDVEAEQLVKAHGSGAAIRFLAPPIVDITSALPAAGSSSAGSGQPEPA